jgi:XRE family aerobic/anaerobic benzoate catabolism transcriptional regulator
VTRRLLAQLADVSERYLGQLEAGDGNISIVLLRRVAASLGVRIGVLLDTEHDLFRVQLVSRFLDEIPAHRVEDMLVRLARELGKERESRRGRIALIGLRGAGKSTLGEALARKLGIEFVELDRVIEEEAGLPLAELFSLYGQAGYRRFERRCLERIFKNPSQAVIAVGGGVVTEPGTFDLLLANCYTIWLKARPDEHMQRVVAQGDLRPMSGSDEAMEDLKRILQAREPLYQKADATVDTTGVHVDAALAQLLDAIAR